MASLLIRLAKLFYKRCDVHKCISYCRIECQALEIRYVILLLTYRIRHLDGSNYCEITLDCIF